MGDQTAAGHAGRAAAIDEFAGALRELRRSAGDPSFREMSGRSRAISHTTLHEAAQGNRLPSWATTVEFVKACRGDPAQYRTRWEVADRAVRESGPAAGATPPDDEPAADVTAVPDLPAAAPAPAPPRGARPGWRRIAIPAAVAVIGAGGAVAVVLASSSDDSPNHPASSRGPALSAADCPIHQSNPPAAPPAHAGDASLFVIDVTLHDCTHVHRDETVTKVWRLKNAGTVTWRGYYLHRLEVPQRRGQCQTVSDVPIRETAPGQTVDVRVQVVAPPSPTFCFVRFKMMDGSGQIVFPGSRPVNLQLIVD